MDVDEGGNQATLPQQSAIRELLLTDEIIEDLVEMQDNERMEDMTCSTCVDKQKKNLKHLCKGKWKTRNGLNSCVDIYKILKNDNKQFYSGSLLFLFRGKWYRD